MLVTSIMVLTAFPVLAAALLVLEIDRKLGAHVFDAASGGAIMWRHLFWFFGHPEVYIVAIPFFGIATEILPVFSRKPLFVYKGMIAATMGIAGLSMTVWAHHMFTTGAVLLPFFSLLSFFIAVPTGIKFFNWTGTMFRGQLTFEAPMLFIIGFMVTFLFGGITGVILASPPLDFAVSDTYFLVAHFHYVPFGTVVFTMFGGIYFWWPKFTGKKLNETLGKWHFWTLFISFWMTFLVMHWEGVAGLPRRVANYPYLPGYVTTLNQISSVGSFMLGASTLFFLYNVYWTWRFGKQVTEVDPGLPRAAWVTGTVARPGRRPGGRLHRLRPAPRESASGPPHRPATSAANAPPPPVPPGLSSRRAARFAMPRSPATRPGPAGRAYRPAAAGQRAFPGGFRGSFSNCHGCALASSQCLLPFPDRRAMRSAAVLLTRARAW